MNINTEQLTIEDAEEQEAAIRRQIADLMSRVTKLRELCERDVQNTVGCPVDLEVTIYPPREQGPRIIEALLEAGWTERQPDNPDCAVLAYGERGHKTMVIAFRQAEPGEEVNDDEPQGCVDDTAED